MPLPAESEILDSALALRTLRLNALTKAFAPLWGQAYCSTWSSDEFATGGVVRLGDVQSVWRHNTPLRAEYDRWLALCEIDAIVALLLGFRCSQLLQIYRSQFAVLRKYECETVFDRKGRQISRHHQHYGVLQRRLEAEAKSNGARTWEPLRDRVRAYRRGEAGVDLGPYVPPFCPADRETVMANAYWTFIDRWDLAPPDETERPT